MTRERPIFLDYYLRIRCKFSTDTLGQNCFFPSARSVPNFSKSGTSIKISLVIFVRSNTGLVYHVGKWCRMASFKRAAVNMQGTCCFLRFRAIFSIDNSSVSGHRSTDLLACSVGWSSATCQVILKVGLNFLLLNRIELSMSNSNMILYRAVLQNITYGKSQYMSSFENSSSDKPLVNRYRNRC